MLAEEKKNLLRANDLPDPEHGVLHCTDGVPVRPPPTTNRREYLAVREYLPRPIFLMLQAATL